MTLACPAPPTDLGLIRAVVGSVDCNVRTFSQAGYQALTAPQSLFPAALTALLTIYVAVLGYRLMFGVGGARLGDAPVIGLKIGAVLAVSLGWTTFQTLVFDLAMKAPLEVARIVGEPAARSGRALAADPLNGLQAAHDEIAADAAAFGRQAGPNPQVLNGGAAQAADGLWKAANILFMSTVGVFVLAMVTAGELSAIGPIFVAFF
ncbi:MAG TPA: type IV secretion system protein, partial [Phenylobacterium sp.]|nr:type IV secretion system protein [Phenylobacterium sp.]